MEHNVCSTLKVCVGCDFEPGAQSFMWKLVETQCCVESIYAFTRLNCGCKSSDVAPTFFNFLQGMYMYMREMGTVHFRKHFGTSPSGRVFDVEALVGRCMPKNAKDTNWDVIDILMRPGQDYGAFADTIRDALMSPGIERYAVVSFGDPADVHDLAWGKRLTPICCGHYVVCEPWVSKSCDSPVVHFPVVYDSIGGGDEHCVTGLPVRVILCRKCDQPIVD